MLIASNIKNNPCIETKFKNIKKFGIHVMPHSNCIDIDYWSKLIDHMFQVIYEISIKLDIDISFMDIGGGFGIPYKPTFFDLYDDFIYPEFIILFIESVILFENNRQIKYIIIYFI